MHTTQESWLGSSGRGLDLTNKVLLSSTAGHNGPALLIYVARSQRPAVPATESPVLGLGRAIPLDPATVNANQPLAAWPPMRASTRSQLDPTCVACGHLHLCNSQRTGTKSAVKQPCNPRYFGWYRFLLFPSDFLCAAILNELFLSFAAPTSFVSLVPKCQS